MVNVKPVTQGKTTRMSFSHIDEVLQMPNLIEVQKNSYQWFLDEGLKEVFKDVSPITDYQDNLVLPFRRLRPCIAGQSSPAHTSGTREPRSGTMVCPSVSAMR